MRRECFVDLASMPNVVGEFVVPAEVTAKGRSVPLAAYMFSSKRGCIGVRAI